MNGFLKTKFLFNEHHLTVNEVCHEQNLVLKGDKTLSNWIKINYNYEMFFKISALK